MILNLIYDAFALAAPQSFRDGMATAANLLAAALYDNITINIDVGYGEYNGQPLPNQNTSEGGDSSFSITYSSLRALLASHETSAADVTSVNALPNTTTLNGQSSFVIGTAEARALGALPANNGTVDGLVGMGTNFTGSVLVGGALHELTHAMGRVPGASGLSLFRYTSQGNHLFTGGTPAAASYFSIDGGVTKLADFGVSSDPSDFLNSPGSNRTPNDPFDEVIAGSTLTSADLTMMDVLGFNVPAVRCNMCSSRPASRSMSRRRPIRTTCRRRPRAISTSKSSLTRPAPAVLRRRPVIKGLRSARPTDTR
jgi:hypothetical protein